MRIKIEHEGNYIPLDGYNKQILKNDSHSPTSPTNQKIEQISQSIQKTQPSTTLPKIFGSKQTAILNIFDLKNPDTTARNILDQNQIQKFFATTLLKKEPNLFIVPIITQPGKMVRTWRVLPEEVDQQLYKAWKDSKQYYKTLVKSLNDHELKKEFEKLMDDIDVSVFEKGVFSNIERPEEVMKRLTGRQLADVASTWPLLKQRTFLNQLIQEKYPELEVFLVCLLKQLKAPNDFLKRNEEFLKQLNTLTLDADALIKESEEKKCETERKKLITPLYTLLNACTRLTSLQLDTRLFQGLPKDFPKLPNLKNVHFTHDHLMYGDSLPGIGNLENLTDLRISSTKESTKLNPAKTDQILLNLVSLTHLTNLELPYFNNQDFLQIFPKTPSLTFPPKSVQKLTLTQSNKGMRVDNIEQKLPNLTTLIIKGIWFFKDIAPHHGIHTLELATDMMPKNKPAEIDSELDLIANAFPNLERFTIQGTLKLEVTDITPLHQLRALKYLDITGLQLDPNLSDEEKNRQTQPLSKFI